MAELETGSFDAVIDKGLTDSVMYNDKFAIMMAKVGYKAQKEACLTGSRNFEGFRCAWMYLTPGTQTTVQWGLGTNASVALVDVYT